MDARSPEPVTRFHENLEHATLSRNPEALCALLADKLESVGMYDTFEKLGNKMGGRVYLESSYTINSVRILLDGKSVIVVRRSGKVLILRSEGKGSISSRS